MSSRDGSATLTSTTKWSGPAPTTGTNVSVIMLPITAGLISSRSTRSSPRRVWSRASRSMWRPLTTPLSSIPQYSVPPRVFRNAMMYLTTSSRARLRLNSWVRSSSNSTLSPSTYENCESTVDSSPGSTSSSAASEDADAGSALPPAPPAAPPTSLATAASLSPPRSLMSPMAAPAAAPVPGPTVPAADWAVSVPDSATTPPPALTAPTAGPATSARGSGEGEAAGSSATEPPGGTETSP
mmetsp:Transcript_19345/g.68418  ORF Transcript_19345/g.68418 Transcript_19345/m.68418 type:complete len:240 (+) Transcript_19345:1011-1730(+)